MSTLYVLLAEAENRGMRFYRVGDAIEYEAPRKPPAELLAQLRVHREELRSLLTGEVPSATSPEGMTPRSVPAPAEAEPWIVSSGLSGSMRLVVATPPEDWVPGVWRAAALVEVLDVRTRADRADAQETADQLQALLNELKREGIEAWLAS